LDAMQYRLTDPWLDPPGVSDADYREESIHLPHSFWCYDEEGMTLGLPAFPSVGSLPATKSGIITFGSLNNFSKVNPEVLRLWAQVLKSTSGSRLLVLVPNAAQRRFTSNLELFGIDPVRVEFAGRQSRDRYLQLFNRIDIGLDTFPYNGHTTTLDALWMGVPVVTLVGKTVVGRAGLSQLSNLGLTELIAHSTGEYVRIASGLAADVDRLAALRSGLRSRMRESPLTDAAGFARGIEAAYRNMWRQWCGRICNEHAPSPASSGTGVQELH
jgi:protein O-GlcNAc transferase